MTKTTAKFVCSEVTKRLHWDGSKRNLHTAKFTPVMSGSEENKKFFEATPSGVLEIGQFQEDLFTPGKEYFLEITEA